MDQPYISTALCCITCNWQCESVFEVFFKKSNKYITNCNKFSLHVNKYVCSPLYVLTYHISSLDSARANATCVKPTKRPAASLLSTLHSWHFYVSDYILLMWFMETFQQQIICIKAQIVMACVSNEQAGLTSTYHCTGNTGMFKLNENKMFVLGDPEWNGLVMTRPVSECSILTPHTPRHLDN